MPTPSKPHDLIVFEGKSHRTKAELEQRKHTEAELVSGKHMQCWPEVKENPAAEKEFKRVRNLLKKINKDDALYEGAINRYALLRAECVEFEEKREEFYCSKRELQEEYRQGGRASDEKAGGLSPSQYYRLLANMQQSIINVDRQIQAKRKMLLDIEKEMALTLASALRSIPKKAQKKEHPAGMASFMAKRNGGSG